MTRVRFLGAVCVAAFVTMTDCYPWEAPPYVVKLDLTQVLDQARVSLPDLPIEGHLDFLAGSWEFDGKGHVHLTRRHAFFNRMDFRSLRGEAAGEIRFHYRTLWAVSDEQCLSLIFHESVDEGVRRRYEIVIRSDGAIRILHRETDRAFRRRGETLLTEARPFPTTNETWRSYRLQIRPNRAVVFVDDKLVLSARLPGALSKSTDPEGLWAIELTREGVEVHRTQALLADLAAFVPNDEGRARELFQAVPLDAGKAASNARYLTAKYQIDRAYFPTPTRYLSRKIARPLGEHEQEHITGWFAPPGSSYRFELRAAPGDRFRARFGYDFGGNLAEQPPVIFSAKARRNGVEHELFRRRATGSEQAERGDLFFADVPLPAAAGEPLKLELSVAPEEGADRDTATFWGEAAVVGRALRSHRRPNVILISVDTLRPDFIGPYSDFADTPAITAFAKDAIRFDEAFTVSPWTVPAHLSLFTGLYPSRHGLNRAFGYNQALADPDVLTLTESLARAGYYTAAIASDNVLDPLYGFDKGFHSFVDATRQDVRFLLPHVERFLNKHQDDQFFLFFHTYDPHSPLFRDDGLSSLERGRLKDVVSYEDVRTLGEMKEEEKEYLRALYANHVRYFDQHFNRFLQSLKDRSLYEEAVIILTSDHGEELLERGAYLHGHSLHEEVMRVPLFLKLPGEDWPLEVETLTGLIDLFPTLASYLKTPLPAGLDGRSFLPVLQDKVRSHRGVLLSEALAYGPERKGVRSRQYSYIWTLAPSDRGSLLPRASAYDNVLDGEAGQELYDVSIDRSERHNLLGDRPELARRLKEHLDRLINARAPESTIIMRDPKRLDALRSLGYIQN